MTFYNEEKWQRELKKAHKRIEALNRRVEKLEKENKDLKDGILNKANRFDIMDLD